MLAVAQPAAAQEPLLDRLQLTALGVGFGRVDPSQVVPTDAYSVHADYGEVARHVRLVFMVTYWDSRFNDETVNEFADRLQSSIIDPSGDDTLRIGRITVSDVALEGDVRWTPLGERFLRPYFGVGLGAHVLNAESPFISGTFVEAALDNIGASFAGAAGIDLVVGRVSLGVQARYNLLSTIRFASGRVVARYEFRRLRRPRSR